MTCRISTTTPNSVRDRLPARWRSRAASRFRYGSGGGTRMPHRRRSRAAVMRARARCFPWCRPLGVQFQPQSFAGARRSRLRVDGQSREARETARMLSDAAASVLGCATSAHANKGAPLSRRRVRSNQFRRFHMYGRARTSVAAKAALDASTSHRECPAAHNLPLAQSSKEAVCIRRM